MVEDKEGNGQGKEVNGSTEETDGPEPEHEEYSIEELPDRWKETIINYIEKSTYSMVEEITWEYSNKEYELLEPDFRKFNDLVEDKLEFVEGMLEELDQRLKVCEDNVEYAHSEIVRLRLKGVRYSIFKPFKRLFTWAKRPRKKKFRMRLTAIEQIIKDNNLANYSTHNEMNQIDYKILRENYRLLQSQLTLLSEEVKRLRKKLKKKKVKTTKLPIKQPISV